MDFFNESLDSQGLKYSGNLTTCTHYDQTLIAKKTAKKWERLSMT